jgi:hypothetical protein
MLRVRFFSGTGMKIIVFNCDLSFVTMECFPSVESYLCMFQ